MGRVANVYFHSELVGKLWKESNAHCFQYDREYILAGKKQISFSLPISTNIIKTQELHGFFSGLVAEGWLRNVQSKARRIDSKDEFSLLIENGHDLIGAITIELQDLP